MTVIVQSINELFGVDDFHGTYGSGDVKLLVVQGPKARLI
jgi:hypothetical protein